MDASPHPTLTLAGQMQQTLDMFWRTMPREAGLPRFCALSVALWQRVRKLVGRFCALYALWKAGTLPKARVRAAAPRPRCLLRPIRTTVFMPLCSHVDRCKKERDRYPDNPSTLHV